MTFLLAGISGILVLNEIGDTVADKLAAATASVHSFGVAAKRKLCGRKPRDPPQFKQPYSEEYQRIKNKYQ